VHDPYGAKLPDLPLVLDRPLPDGQKAQGRKRLADSSPGVLQQRT
jgi:hypothetical protein